MGWWVADYLQGHPQGAFIVVAWIFWVLLSISLHELAHGWAAIWEGDDTPVRTGHMTWNPVVHMGMMSIVVFLLVGIAWGLMPVNPHKFRHGRKGDALVAAAGPLMNLLIALIAASILVVVSGTMDESTTRDKLILFFHRGAVLNVVLFLLNLIPIPPLDGSRILAGFSRKAEDLYRHPEVAQYSMFALIAVFWFGGGALFTAAATGVGEYWAFMSRLLF
ncbi:MAG: site-2 protease family protein [Planctomycetota bacterium]